MPNLWIDSIFDMQLSSGSQQSVSLMTGVTEVETRLTRMTLLRTIIGINVGWLIHDSAEGTQKVAVGIGIAPQGAFAANELPNPATPGEFPTRGWVWRATALAFGFTAGAEQVYTSRYDLDIRAKRKLDNGEAFLTARNDPEQGVASVIGVIGMVRQLWLVG